LTRPIVAADEDMGYLPGDMDQKMEPWTKPMFDIFEKYLSHNQIDRYVHIEPLGYMRGRTFDNTSDHRGRDAERDTESNEDALDPRR
jgi:phosphate starvation-inducible PhoH-like protein